MKILKIIGRVVLAIIILLTVLITGALIFLSSKELGPTVERLADDYIDGHLKIGSLKLGFNPGFPILRIEADSVILISNTFKELTDDERGRLPEYADSLLSVDHLSGAIDLKRLLVNNEIALHDMMLRGLGVNIVIAHNGEANYAVAKIPHENKDSKKKHKISGFRIDRFALDNPKEMRFYNAADSTSASVLLLTDAAVESEKEPEYRLKINGNVMSHKATLLTNLEQISFGLNGKVYWDTAKPGLVAVDKFMIRGAFIRALVTGEVDFTSSPIINRAVVELTPVALTDLLTLLPDSIKKTHRLDSSNFHTNLCIGGKLELTQPMNLTTDTVPSARISLNVPPASLQYGKARFEELAFDVTINTVRNSPDQTVIDVKRCVIAGEATRMEAHGLISNLISDPSFSAGLNGNLDLANLPPLLHEKIGGYVSGIITAKLNTKGRASMFKQENMHRLLADGSISADNLYFLSADTANMIQLHNAKINFDSQRRVKGTPLLNAKVEVDTANILSGGVDIAFSNFALDAGVKFNDNTVDTTLNLPVVGKFNVASLNIISITDSAGGRIRNIGGNLKIKRFNSHKRMPEILARLNTGRVSAGSLSDRILLDNANITANLRKLPAKPKKKENRTKSTHTNREYNYISPAKVFRYVYAKRHHRPHNPHVYIAQSNKDVELLEWNIAKGFRKFITGWNIKGTVNTRNARLLTPLFPMRNHFSNIDLKFNNDTINISDITLRAESSDITLSGLVTNVTGAMTSRNNNNLKANLSILSDTIDINRIASVIFRGAAYADRKRRGKIHSMKTDNDDELGKRIDKLSKEDPGTSAPVLIPVNVTANLKLGAANILYSDLVLQDVAGDVLLYDGGVNLNNLNATSDAGNLSVSALYSAASPDDMHFGFGLNLQDFNVGKFVQLVPAIDSITPLIHDFSGTINADIAATCRIDSGMNFVLPSLDAAMRITGDNLAFIDPKKYRTLGKWLGFKNKADNTIHHLNVEMTVAHGLMRVYPFAFNIDRYRLGIYGSNDINMNFDYHLSVLKSPLPFRFGITISGNPKKHKVRFGGAKFKENSVVESIDVVKDARINLLDQIQDVFKRGVRNSRFAKVRFAQPAGFDEGPDPGLSASDSLQLIREGLIEAPDVKNTDNTDQAGHDKISAKKKKHKKKSAKKND
ncbi:MAG: AsmA-like C-terminal region-containing protein [Bacteroidales bacterium]|nr:AsmA-like C-terminal region-containing protein [Bacteroidales bacterium]